MDDSLHSSGVNIKFEDGPGPEDVVKFASKFVDALLGHNVWDPVWAWSFVGLSGLLATLLICALVKYLKMLAGFG